jgi:hypothetical protein
MIEPCGVPILAVDFDGCLCDSSWPELGDPIMPVLSAAKRRQEQGWKIILCTCDQRSDGGITHQSDILFSVLVHRWAPPLSFS